MAMYDTPWYEVSGPNSKNPGQEKMFVGDFTKYLKDKGDWDVSDMPTEEMYKLILEYTVYNAFCEGQAGSWRGYATFKKEIFVDVNVVFIENQIRVHKSLKFLKKYICKFKERYWAPPYGDFPGGKGYLKLSEETKVGKSQ